MAFPKINIKLRIVGLYFNETIRIENVPTLTVKNIIDKYVKANPLLDTVGGLDYETFTPTGGDPFISAFIYNFGGSYNFDGDRTSTGAVDGKSLGNIARKAGIYKLAEDFQESFINAETKNVGLVWQYYVSDINEKVKSKTPVSRKFNSFAIAPLPTEWSFAEGDTVTWRLVAIAREPNGV